jgi:hypothetical protein
VFCVFAALTFSLIGGVQSPEIDRELRAQEPALDLTKPPQKQAQKPLASSGRMEM